MSNAEHSPTGETGAPHVVPESRWPRVRHLQDPRRFVAGLAVAGAGLAGVAFASPAFAAGLGIAGISCVSAAGTATLTFYNDGEPETVST